MLSLVRTLYNKGLPPTGTRDGTGLLLKRSNLELCISIPRSDGQLPQSVTQLRQITLFTVEIMCSLCRPTTTPAIRRTMNVIEKTRRCSVKKSLPFYRFRIRIRSIIFARLAKITDIMDKYHFSDHGFWTILKLNTCVRASFVRIHILKAVMLLSDYELLSHSGGFVARRT